MNILIAEDNEDSRVLLRDVLIGSGHRVESAVNGKEALDILDKGFQAELIVSDILMPDMDGYALCKRLKEDGKHCNIPFVFYTATYTSPEDEELALNLGADRFLIKPMEIPSLLKELDGVCKGFQKREPKPESSLDNDYSRILSKKLNKKMCELEEERDRLKKSEKKYRRLVEALRQNYLFYTRDANGRFNYVSPSVYTVLGYTQEEFLAKPPGYMRRNPVNCGNSENALSLLGAEKKQCYEVEVGHANGSLKRLEITEEPIRGRDRELVGVDGFAHDITSRYDMEEKIREARDDWERTFQSIMEPVFLLDREMRIQRANDATCRLIGKEPADISGKLCSELFKCEGNAGMGCPARKALQLKKKVEQELYLPDLEKTLLVSCFPKLNSDGELVGIVHTAKDLTERKAIEKQMGQKHKMESLGRMAGGIAHDFNNIVMAIAGYGEILLEDLEDTPSASDVKVILDSCTRAKELASQILTFSRNRERKREPVKPAKIAWEALKMLRASIPPSVKIKEDFTEEECTIEADPTNIHQIVVNLCTNARLALKDDSGELSIGVKKRVVNEDRLPPGDDLRAGSYIVLTVSDTGCGMDQTTQDRIFEPYFTTREAESGTGLGLAVVHGIVKDCGGFIELRSELGKGTTFSLYFPEA